MIREYQCQNEACNGERLETTCSFYDAFTTPFCPHCGNRMTWAPTAMNFSLKGDWPGKKIKVERGPK